MPAGVTSLLRRFRRWRANRSLPASGYLENRVATRYVDSLSDTDLDELNRLLPWQAFTVDSSGRRFGGVAWRGKRDVPQPVPDARILAMHRHFDLGDQHVLEFGCFEGLHTVALCQLAGNVTAIDSRMENVVKTIVRCAMFGYAPRVFKWDLEEGVDPTSMCADILHHVGVLYHLADPVAHLQALPQIARRGIMLDTHYCSDEQATSRYSVGGESFAYYRFKEGGRADVFSGMRDHAKWLPLGTIQALLERGGFTDVRIQETRNERNGPRVLLYAQR
jgi:tRNA (mo5U34)-methyltransferase